MTQPGLLRRLFRDPVPVLDEVRETCGPVAGLGAGPVRMAIVGGASALGELFAMPTDAFRWGHKFNVLGFVVGDGSMIVSDGADWKRRRSSVQAAFSRRRLNGWIPMIIEQTDVAIDDLLARDRRPEPVDLYPIGRSMVLAVVVRSLFGERMAGRVQEIGDLFQPAQDYLEAPAIRQLPHPFPFTARARVREHRRAMDALIDEEIADRRRHPSGDPLDVLEALVADDTVSEDEIRDQVVTLIGAGFDTTAASFAWMLTCASRDPDVWCALRTEADAVYGPASAAPVDPDHTTLAGLDLARRVMRETLRLHPAGVISPREAAIDVDVGGYRIRKGTLVLWSAHLAGRDPDAWTDPLRFDPERFADLDPEQERLADASWVPFGRGARNCIGFALAQMELTLMISRVAQRLDVTPERAAVPKPVGMVINRPEGGVVARVAGRPPDRAVR